MAGATTDEATRENEQEIDLLGDEETLSDDMDTTPGDNQGDSGIPENEEMREPPSGYVLETDDSDLPIGGIPTGGLPTGGLPTGGTIGGIPVGDV